jgi:hypothetical protein
VPAIGGLGGPDGECCPGGCQRLRGQLSGVAEVGERDVLGVEGGQHDQFGSRGVAGEVVLEAGVGEQGDRVHHGGERAPGRVRQAAGWRTRLPVGGHPRR